MTEQEYIDVGDLKAVRTMNNLLREIIPENSNFILSKEQRIIARILHRWGEKLSKDIKIDDQERG